MAEAVELLATAYEHDPHTRQVAEEKLAGGDPSGDGIALGAFSRDGTLLGVGAAAGGCLKVLAVSAPARRQGVARALMGALEGAGGRLLARVAACPGNYLTPGLDPRYEAAARLLERGGFRRSRCCASLRLFLPLRLPAPGAEPGEPPTIVDDAAAAIELAAEFSAAWAFEAGRAEIARVALEPGSRRPIACAVARANNRAAGWFGPAGTLPEAHGRGAGAAVTRACLEALAAQGLRQTIIPWVASDAAEFYRRTVGALPDRRFDLWTRT
jgi:GNAT superfamily N-acetyltransferase